MAQFKCYACARLREASTWAGFGVALGAAVPMLDHGTIRTALICAIALGYADPESRDNSFVSDRLPLADFVRYHG